MSSFRVPMRTFRLASATPEPVDTKPTWHRGEGGARAAARAAPEAASPARPPLADHVGQGLAGEQSQLDQQPRFRARYRNAREQKEQGFARSVGWL